MLADKGTRKCKLSTTTTKNSHMTSAFDKFLITRKYERSMNDVNDQWTYHQRAMHVRFESVRNESLSWSMAWLINLSPTSFMKMRAVQRRDLQYKSIVSRPQQIKFLSMNAYVKHKHTVTWISSTCALSIITAHFMNPKLLFNKNAIVRRDARLLNLSGNTCTHKSSFNKYQYISCKRPSLFYVVVIVYHCEGMTSSLNRKLEIHRVFTDNCLKRF